MSVPNREAIQHCVFAVVGEYASELDLRAVIGFATSLRGKVALVRVLPDLTASGERTPLEAGLQADEEMRAKAAFSDWVNATAGADAWLETDVLRHNGDFMKTVARSAADWSASVIALTGMEPAEIEATTDLAHTSRLPVLVPLPSTRSTEVVLVATSLTDDDLPVTRYGLALARSLGARPLLIYNASEPDGAEAASARLRRALDSLASELGVEATDAAESIVSCHGSPGLAILELAAERSPELIVMGSYPRSLLTEWLVPSVCKSVLARMPCAVLVLPLCAEIT